MKKHFLFSTMFALTAALSYGQTVATTGSTPTPVTCTDDALHPIIGKEYTYKGTGTPTGGTYHIFATNSTNFIQNGALNTTGAYTATNGLLKAGTGYNVNTNSTGETKLSWSGAATNPSFVVIQYKQNGTCTTDNLKVYKIEPKNAFIIEIRNMKKGTGNNFTTEALNTNIDVCSANIQSATYNGTKMVYNYGSQSFYYELIAANYDKDFTPKVKIDGLQTGQTAKLKWGYSKTTMNTEIASVTNNTEVTLPKIIADTAIEPSKGVSIYLELVVENGSYEGTTDKNITLSVDATSGAKNFKNVKRADCSDEADFADKAIQVLKARPAISPNTGVNFIAQ
jgi:hypothetical protein